MGLTAAATELPLALENDDEISGFYSVLYETLRSKLNESFDVKFIGNLEYGELYSDKDGSGILGSLIRNESQFSIMPLFLNKKSVDWLDYTTIIETFDYNFISGYPKHFTKNYFESLKSFQKSVWTLMFLSLPVISLLFVLLTALRWKHVIKSNRKTIENALFESYASLMNQGINTGKFLYARVLWIFWIIACFVLTSSFTGVMFSKLAMPDTPFRYEKLEDLFVHPIKLFVLRDTPPCEDLQASRLPMKMKTWNKVHSEESALSFDNINMLEIFNDFEMGKLVIILDSTTIHISMTMMCGVVKDLYLSKESYMSAMMLLLMSNDLADYHKKTIKAVANQFLETKIMSSRLQTLIALGKLCIVETEEEQDIPISMDKLYFIFIISFYILCLASLCVVLELLICK